MSSLPSQYCFILLQFVSRISYDGAEFETKACCQLATGILFLKQVGTPSASPWDSTGINWTIPYYTMSLSLNIIVTILIVARLLVYRARISRVMGKGHGAEYASLAAMIVESAAIYSTFSIMFLIPFATGSPIAQLFLQALSPVQVIYPFCLIC